MGRSFPIFFALLLLALTGPARSSFAHDGGDGNGPGNNPGNTPSHSPDKTNGGYKLTFAGYLSGTGTGTVSGQTLTISGHVKDPAGHAIDFQIQCDADKNRFKGTGDAGGVTIDIEGRFDPADRTGRVVRGARVVATYATSDGHHGRVAGERSADADRPPTPDHDDDHDHD